MVLPSGLAESPHQNHCRTSPAPVMSESSRPVAEASVWRHGVRSVARGRDAAYPPSGA
jgi:hypothetical protein